MKNLGNSEDRAPGIERGGGMGSVKRRKKEGRDRGIESKGSKG